LKQVCGGGVGRTSVGRCAIGGRGERHFFFYEILNNLAEEAFGKKNNARNGHALY
jgi:hypothetical protein